MHRYPVRTLGRFLALFLGLCLSLPTPAFALRVQNGGLEERTPTTRAIENALRSEESASPTQTTGLEETGQERKIKEAIRNLARPESGVVSAAQETLTAFAQNGIATNTLAAAVPQLIEYLARPEWRVVSAAQETLTAFAQNEKMRQTLKTAGIMPKTLGFPTGITWDDVGQIEEANQALASRQGYADLSLGARALLRRKLYRQAAPTSRVEVGRRWMVHMIRLEQLDQRGGMTSAGAEIHLPVEERSPDPLKRLAGQMGFGAGQHSMVPWILEADGRQMDIRLLPAYPTLFRRLLAEFLGDPALESTATVGAHYSVGLDLRGELVPVALALYYGDENYLEAPQAGSAEGGVGFPGVWTYRGQSLDLKTGQVTNTNQSNLHLRPLRTLVGKISLDLFQHDVDRLGWLASAAAAPVGDPRQTLYQQFKDQWEQWVRTQGGKTLLGTVQAAEQEVAGKTGAGVSPALDKASADLLATLVRTPDQGATARKELVKILNTALNNLEESAWGSAAAAKAVRAYRESEGLADLDRTLDRAVKTVANEIFSTETPRGSPREAQLLNVLEALDPSGAQKIRDGLRSTGGLEERGSALETARRVAVADQVRAYLRDLTRSSATIQVLDPEMLEQYPELAPLATLSELSDSILIDRGEATLEHLRAQSARWVDYYGLPINADRFSRKAGGMTVIPHTPGEESFVQFLSDLLHAMAPLKLATQAEVEHLAAQLLQLAA